jgi:hypothetical protein
VIGDLETVNPETLNCAGNTHYHVSREEAYDMERRGEAEWLQEPLSRRAKGVLRILQANYGLRGLSCKMGATLAEALRNKETWAQVMLKDIRHA